MIDATALLQKLQDCEAELAELQKKAEFHQQQVAGHNNELRACQNNMIHIAGKRDAIKEMLAPAEPPATPAPATEQPVPARRARKR